MSPAFKYGKSVELGTGVPGAFAANPSASRRSRQRALNALSVQQPSEPLRAAPAASRGARNGASPTTTARQSQGGTLAALLKAAAESGVGFD